MKRSILGALVLLPALAWSMGAEEHVRNAQKLMRRGRLKDARVELEVAKRLAPQREDVQELLDSLDGKVAEKPAGAKATVEKSVAAPAASKLEGLLAQARSAYKESDLKGAADAWQKALLVAPKDEEASHGLAQLESERYKRDTDQPFDQSVAELYDSALREKRKGRLVEAKRKLDDALALNPTQAQVKQALVDLSSGAREQQAGRDAEQCVMDGQAALADGEWAKAGAAFQEALKQAPQLRAAKEGLAQVRAHGGAVAQKALALGNRSLENGDWDEAEKQFSLALSLDPELQGAAEGKQAAQRKARLAQSRAQQSQQANKLYNQGVEAWSAGDLGLAASRFREVLKVDPEDAEAKRALQSVRRKLDERADKDRLDAQRLVEEGRTLEGRGAPEEALKRYERALAKDPAQAEAERAKKRLLAELKAP